MAVLHLLLRMAELCAGHRDRTRPPQQGHVSPTDASAAIAAAPAGAA